MRLAAAHQALSEIANELSHTGSTECRKHGTGLDNLLRELNRLSMGEATPNRTYRAAAHLHQEFKQLAEQVTFAKTECLPSASDNPTLGVLAAPDQTQQQFPDNSQPKSKPSKSQSKYMGARPKNLAFTRINLGPRIYTSQEVAKIICTDDSTIRRKASRAWLAGDGSPQPLPGEPRWYVAGQGNINGGRRCGWRLQQVQKQDLQG